MAPRFPTILCTLLLVSGLTGCVPYYRSPYWGSQGRQHDRDHYGDQDRDHDHDHNRDWDHDRDRD